MDASQIAMLSTGLSNMQLSGELSTTVLKKSLDNQKDTVNSLIQSIPPLPANPAIGRNINTTA
ncbi:putative motility protein [Dickeya sp. CFBP 2040]|uniref:Putative motility protein n=1 Tax=Dickeya poaceiphila TaxID=568768 RepID=A0A5B8I3V7_9GAMM|nr:MULTISPECIES: YjfB family protein [Dickeya]NKI74087.1 putative motility protein [Dickeya sp. CFBP 2040]QDX29303.1 putative motility protein [Dickeya poaceiphila]